MKGKVNREWHASHRMPANPTKEERVEWHAQHSAACGCREAPPALLADVHALGEKRASRAR